MPLLQVGKQVVVAQSEIKAVRRVVNLILVEMLQQCLSASSCMWMHIVMKEYYTGCQQSTPFVLNEPAQLFSVSQYPFDVIVVPCCMNFTIGTPFLMQKTVAISFLADIY
jgi:hypothetical protein